jgi:alpha-1,2-mannosyltransferase
MLRTLRTRPTLWAAVAFAVSLAAYLVVRALTAPTSIDLAVYRVEGTAIRDGINLYGTGLPTPKGLRATYPPFAAIVFVPISYLAWAVTQVFGVVANLALLVVVSDQACRLARVSAPNRIAAALLLAAVALWAEPVLTTFRYGQINLALLALIQWDFLRRDGARLRGIGIGLATGIKITPGLFVVYLLLTRRFRMAFNAAVACVVTVALSAAIVPSSTWKFWTHLLWDSSRVGRIENAANQSIRGLLARILHTRDVAPGWNVLVVAALVAGLWCAVYVQRRLGDGWAVPVCAVTGMLAAPIAWTHHWVWCIPIVALLWSQRRPWLPIALVFWTFAVWAVPHTPPRELHFALWQTALSAWYVVFGVVFVILAVVTARQVSLRASVGGGADGSAVPPAPPAVERAPGRTVRPAPRPR